MTRTWLDEAVGSKWERRHENRKLHTQPLEPDQLLIRGTPAWDARERQREMCGFHCISLGPIPKGLGFGEKLTRAQRTNLLKARDGHWDTMKVTR